MIPDDSATDAVDFDERAERWFTRGDMVLGSVGLALFVNAAILGVVARLTIYS